MPKKVKSRRVWTPEKKAEVRAYAQKQGVPAASEKYDVSQASIYEWIRKAKLANASTSAKAKKPRKRKVGVRTAARRVTVSAPNTLETENAELRNLVIDQLLEIRRLRG